MGAKSGRVRHHGSVAALIASATLWLLMSLAFILGAIEAPRRHIQLGMMLLTAEFVILVVAGSSAECSGGPCVGSERITEMTGPWEAVVSYVIPALTAAYALFLVAYGVRHHRRTTA